jgi:hypothetical protein
MSPPNPPPFALSLSKGAATPTPFALSLSKGFDKLSPNGDPVPGAPGRR